MDLSTIAQRQTELLKEREGTIEIPELYLKPGEDKNMTFRYKKLNALQQKTLTEKHPKSLELALIAEKYYKGLSGEEIQEKITPEHMALFQSMQSFAIDVVCECVTVPKITRDPGYDKADKVSVGNIPMEIIEAMYQKITEQTIKKKQKKA